MFRLRQRGKRERGSLGSRSVYHLQIKLLAVRITQSIYPASDREWQSANDGSPTTNDERPDSSYAQLIGRFQWRSAAAADDSRAIATGQRIANFHGADRAVEQQCGLFGGWRDFRIDLHDDEL
jgi:hypothetical protein